MHTPLQYPQTGHSYPAAPYAGLPGATAPAPAAVCSVNFQQAASVPSYTTPSVQPQATANVSAVPQHVAQSYQAPGQPQQQAPAADSLTFPLQVQQMCQSFVAQIEQHTQSVSGYSIPVQQQTAAAATILPGQKPAQSFSHAPVSSNMGAMAQCHPAQAPNTLQQVQATVRQPSQQTVQSSSTPALYSQQIHIQQEHHQSSLQNSQFSTQQTQNAAHSYIQPHLQSSQEAVHPIHQQFAPQTISQPPSLQSLGQHQVHTTVHSQKSTQTAVGPQSQDASQNTVLQIQTTASQTHPTATPVVQGAANHLTCPAPCLPDAVSPSNTHCTVNVLQQQSTPTPSQYQAAQSTIVAQTHGGANQVLSANHVTPQSLPQFFQHSQAAHITQQVGTVFMIASL